MKCSELVVRYSDSSLFLGESHTELQRKNRFIHTLKSQLTLTVYCCPIFLPNSTEVIYHYHGFSALFIRVKNKISELNYRNFRRNYMWLREQVTFQTLTCISNTLRDQFGCFLRSLFCCNYWHYRYE